MLTHPLKLVTIVAEPVLEQRITHELRAMGASGFTVVEGRGEGSRGMHATEIPGINVRIETIVPPPIADAIVEHIAHQYFTDYAVIAYVSDVAVVRGDKYLTATKGAR
jgi:nitrogen regulatory protein P-II 2